MVVNGELLRTKTLSDSDAGDLYNDYPELRSSYQDYCPTCHTKGFYVLKGKKEKCDCALQLQLHKYYLMANIGMLYQRLDWSDYKLSDTEAKQLGKLYVAKHDLLIRQGTGLLLYGSYGTGKTFIATMILKDLVKLGYTCYSVTMAKMIDMFTSGWTSQEEKRKFEKKVKRSQILLLDDVGKEFRSTKTNLSESTFDSVLRDRAQAGRPTFITTNETVENLGTGYGGAVLSLLSEISMDHKFTGEDYRPKAGKTRIEEVKNGDIRPIV